MTTPHEPATVGAGVLVVVAVAGVSVAAGVGSEFGCGTLAHVARDSGETHTPAALKTPSISSVAVMFLHSVTPCSGRTF